MTATTIADLLGSALADLDAELGVRGETEADFPFVCDLYAEVRHEELTAVPWPQAARRAFLDSQCRLQRDHYRQHYPDAEFMLILRQGKAIGRVYVDAKPREWRLMDVALLGAERKHGIGTRIITTLKDACAARGATLTLHVEPNNPAQRLYARHGFTLIEHRGVYDFLGWPGPALPCPATDQDPP